MDNVVNADAVDIVMDKINGNFEECDTVFHDLKSDANKAYSALRNKSYIGHTHSDKFAQLSEKIETKANAEHNHVINVYQCGTYTGNDPNTYTSIGAYGAWHYIDIGFKPKLVLISRDTDYTGSLVMISFAIAEKTKNNIMITDTGFAVRDGHMLGASFYMNANYVNYKYWALR